jgi:HEPN domain-containing protein
MTNREEGEKLIKEAESIFRRDLTSSMDASDWNLAVRRAQEVVETALKGALRIFGVEYPKVHDVGEIFAEQARRKIESMDENTIKRIREISKWLAKERVPSFYLEKEYSEGDARKAFEDSSWVLKEIIRLFVR